MAGRLTPGMRPKVNIDNAIAAAMHILETVGVASVPGSSFFSDSQGEGLVRFCYAKDWPVLREACERLRQLR